MSSYKTPNDFGSYESYLEYLCSDVLDFVPSGCTTHYLKNPKKSKKGGVYYCKKDNVIYFSPLVSIYDFEDSNCE